MEKHRNRNTNKKILFVYTNFSTFVKTDYEILAERYKVQKYQFKATKGLINTGLAFSKQFFYLLFNIWKYDAVFVWFADYHSFLPVIFAKLLRKKSFVVVGGYDICRIKSLDYGVFVSKFRGFFAFYSMRFCSCNFTVSNYVDRRLKWIAPKASREIIFNSVRLKRDFSKKINKKKMVLTVGQINNEQTFYRKGIDTFIEVAKKTPEFEFIIVGIDQQNLSHLIKNTPHNLKIFEKVEQNELIQFYEDAIIYAQFSRMDTFCLTLAEAMLFGCNPIISNEGGMPEVVGNSGFVVKRDVAKIASLIVQIFENKILVSENPQIRIVEKFSMRIREKKIIEMIDK